MSDPKDKTGGRTRNRFYTTPNPLRPLSLTMKPLELDSPVVRAIEILKKVQAGKLKQSHSIIFHSFQALDNIFFLSHIFCSFFDYRWLYRSRCELA
jgi:hypothetical protein